MKKISKKPDKSKKVTVKSNNVAEKRQKSQKSRQEGHYNVSCHISLSFFEFTLRSFDLFLNFHLIEKSI